MMWQGFQRRYFYYKWQAFTTALLCRGVSFSGIQHQHLSNRVVQCCTTTETRVGNSMSHTRELVVLGAFENYENDGNFKKS